METTVKFGPLPDYGDLMDIAEFLDAVRTGFFIDYDGIGYWATKTEISNLEIFPSTILKMTPPEWATHVAWFNK